MKYALFDWDNTLREGFTLFSWIDFLKKEGAISATISEKIDYYSHQYETALINHDQYAFYACKSYAECVKGMPKSKREQLLDGYFKIDNSTIFPFVRKMFCTFNENNIKVIIISGAPQYILERYQSSFHISEIYAFSEEYSNGIATGNVLFNYGVDKINVVKKIKSKFGCTALAAFGDSSSDIPMLEGADNAFQIVNSSKGKPKALTRNIPLYLIDCKERDISGILKDTLFT